MKQNGNDKVKGNYYVGLDVGTSSAGWAVTDKEYNLLRFKGKDMWGARLFDEAQDASGRLKNRSNRRRLATRKQRLLLLETLFADELAKVDPNFICRMEESALWKDDKTDKTCRFSLFHDEGFSDKDYYRRYPTIYHLRSDLMHSSAEHDIRLVYLALHHILKYRGHFLYETGEIGEKIPTVQDLLRELKAYLIAEFDTLFEAEDDDLFCRTLLRSDVRINEKKKLLKSAWGKVGQTDCQVNLSAAVDLLAGATVKLSVLFNDDELKDADPASIKLETVTEANLDSLSAVLEEREELVLRLKDIYDAARLSQILEGHASISEAKIALYDKNKEDLACLKAYVRSRIPQKYKEIFYVRICNL